MKKLFHWIDSDLFSKEQINTIKQKNKDMEIAITGHTSGIGKGLYDFYRENHLVQGFSRSNGYDISKKTDEIIEQAKNCDIFFNNAYSGFAQTDLLFKLWEQWKDQSKLIINTNSVICGASYPYAYHTIVSKYKIHKLSLDRAVKELQQTPSKCQVSQMKFGFVNTNFFLHRDKMFVRIFGHKKQLAIQEAVKMANLIVTTRPKFKINDMVIGEIC